MSKTIIKCGFPECDEPAFDKGYCLKHAIQMEDFAYSQYMDKLHEPPEDYNSPEETNIRGKPKIMEETEN